MSGAGEGDFLDIGVSCHLRTYHHSCAIDKIDNALGQIRFVKALHHQASLLCTEFAWLDNAGATCRNGCRYLGGNKTVAGIPWNDNAHHAHALQAYAGAADDGLKVKIFDQLRCVLEVFCSEVNQQVGEVSRTAEFGDHYLD